MTNYPNFGLTGVGVCLSGWSDQKTWNISETRQDGARVTTDYLCKKSCTRYWFLPNYECPSKRFQGYMFSSLCIFCIVLCCIVCFVMSSV